MARHAPQCRFRQCRFRAAGASATRAATRCRNRRFTRLRITAFPRDRSTIKPTRGAERPALAPTIAAPSGIRAAWTTRVGRPTRTPRLVVRWKSLELRILNDRGNTAVDRPRQADSRARPLRRRAEIMLRPARVRIRRRKPWVRLRRRLLGWNVRLLTGKLPNPRSGQQFRYGAHTARIAGGAGRWQRPLWKRPSNGTGHRQTGQTNAVCATRAEPMPFRWPTTWGIGACHLRAPISRAAAVR